MAKELSKEQYEKKSFWTSLVVNIVGLILFLVLVFYGIKMLWFSGI